MSLSFHAYEECPNRGCTHLVHEFDGAVVLDSDLEINMESK
jgi:hypothetical protein